MPSISVTSTVVEGNTAYYRGTSQRGVGGRGLEELQSFGEDLPKGNPRSIQKYPTEMSSHFLTKFDHLVSLAF